MNNIVLIGSKGNIGSRIVRSSVHSYIEIDLDNQAAFFELKQIDIVLHFGEMSSPRLSLEESICNIENTLAYFKHAINAGCKSFIYASSHRVYGSWETSLDLPLVPTTNYGKAKLTCERALCDLSPNDMSILVLRIGSILGEDVTANEELERLNNEWKGKYDITRSLFKDFLSRIDELITQDNMGHRVMNVLPIDSPLNQKFDGQNFYSN